MADVITRLKVESSEYDAKIKRATASLQDMTAAAEKQGRKIATAAKENVALAKALGNMQTVATSVRGKMNELTAAFENATHTYNRLTTSEKNSPFGRALKSSVDQLQVRIKNLRQEMQTTQGILGKGGGMASSVGVMGQFKQGLGSAAAMFGPAAIAIGGVTAAIGGMKKVVGDMVRINMEFEQSTANLASVMGKSRDEISDLTNQAKQLGATTQYTAVQITELQENLARLGFTQNEILNSTKSVQALATATGADLGEAANLAGAALRGFGLNATEMERVASVLAVSTTKSALSFEKLATAVPIVAPVAKQFGFTIEDVTTLLGKLSDAGFDASSAATATRNIFLKLADSNGKLAQALGRPIKSIEDLAPALVELKNKGIDLAEMLALTDKRSVAAFATFVDSAGTMTDFKNSITDCSDALQTMVDERLNTLEGSVTILKSSWEGLLLTFSSSNGILKECTDALARLLQAWTNWRKRNQGGMEGASTYETGVTSDIKKQLDEQIAAQRAKGVADEALIQGSEAKKKKLEEEREKLLQLEKVWLDYQQAIQNAANAGMAGGKTLELALKKAEDAENKLIAAGGSKGMTREQIQKGIADKTDRIAQHDYIISALTPSSGTTTGGTTGGEDAETRSKKQLQILKAQYEEQEKMHIAALDREHMTEEEYEAQVYQIKRETLQKIADLYNDETAEKARANAALHDLDIRYQATQMRLAQKAQREAEKEAKKNPVEVPIEFNEEGIRALGKKIKDAMSKLEIGSGDYLIAAENLADFNAFQNLLNTALKNGLDIDTEWLNSLFEDVKIGADVDDSTWQALVNKINEQLAGLGLNPIQLNFETGNLSEVKQVVVDEFKELTDELSSGVGAISTLGNAFDNLKNIGEDLADAFSGEMDAWDSLMTVFNSGISIMETVVGVMEAINTLQELSAALKAKNAAAAGAEAAAVVAGKTTETTAEVSETAVAATETGVHTGLAASEAGSAMAGIPIVGPILAVLAIAAVLGSIIAAVSKGKSSTNSFSGGGTVGGNSPSGDNVIAWLNSDEGVLTRKGVGNARDMAMAAQAGNGNLRLHTDVSGTDLRIVLDNDNRSQGGSRGAYRRIK